MTAPRHRKGEPFTEADLDQTAGETLTENGSIRRGQYLIVPNAFGYRYMEQFGRYSLSRPMKSYSLARIRAVVDHLNARIETESHR